MNGIVLKSTGSWYNVLVEPNKVIECRTKGKLRLKGIKHTNPVTVGDEVEIEMEPGRETGIITSIKDRKNYIIRKANNMSKQTHVIAANVDYAILIVTPLFPKTSLGFIDRFLVTAEAYHIPAVLVFNKTDLFKNDLEILLNDYIDLYENKVGYTCLKTSVVTGEGLDELKLLLKNKKTLITGHSGVGKSSLINAICPELNLKTTEISNYSLKGQHTTTFAEMHPLPFGGYIIDTPGIREFGLVDFEKTEISHYFKEMQPYIGQCKFNNCIHVNEPECMILHCVNEGKIAYDRYNSYISMLNNEDIYD
ncbi:MAG: ribosome small subunit-dependent GTPase A [Bacteroidia bacterium]